MSALKPDFDTFLRAMMYDDRRAQAGIRLNVFEAHALLRDEVALIAYYANWKPDFRPVRRQRRPKYTAAQQARAVFAGVISTLLIVAVLLCGAAAAWILFGALTGDGLDLPVIGG